MEIRQPLDPLRQSFDPRVAPARAQESFGQVIADRTAPPTVVRESPRGQRADNGNDYGELLRQARLEQAAARPTAAMASSSSALAPARALAAYSETSRMAARDTGYGELVGFDQYA